MSNKLDEFHNIPYYFLHVDRSTKGIVVSTADSRGSSVLQEARCRANLAVQS
jgi:hypothetical protein